MTTEYDASEIGMLCLFQLHILYMYHPEVYKGNLEAHTRGNYQYLVKWKEFLPNLEKVIDSFKGDWNQQKECLFKMSQSLHDDKENMGISFLKRILEKEPDNAKINYYAAMACLSKVKQNQFE